MKMEKAQKIELLKKLKKLLTSLAQERYIINSINLDEGIILLKLGREQENQETETK